MAGRGSPIIGSSIKQQPYERILAVTNPDEEPRWRNCSPIDGVGGLDLEGKKKWAS